MAKGLLRFVSASVFALLATAALAKDSDDARMDAIWDAAYDRMNSQIDVWFENGDYPRVVHLLRFQSSLFPSDFEVITNLGWMLENIENYPEALATYVAFRNNNPQNPDSSLPEAQFYYMQKVYAKVPPLLEPVIKRKPHPNNFRILAHAYEKMNLLGDSCRVWKSYLELAPEDQPAKRNLERVEKKIKGELTMKHSTR